MKSLLIIIISFFSLNSSHQIKKSINQDTEQFHNDLIESINELKTDLELDSVYIPTFYDKKI